MNKYNDLLRKLEEEEKEGCDFDPLFKEAADAIRELVVCVELWQGKNQHEQTQSKILREIAQDSCAWGKDTCG